MHPLVVDLDGSLILTDMLHETTLRILRDSPLDLLHIPRWLWRGKARLKRELANRSDFNPASLPYHLELLDWIRQERAGGRTIILCTASEESIALEISNYLGLFDEVLASDGVTNLSGQDKAQLLENRFGQGGFDYVGNSFQDLPVWKAARRAIVVTASAELLRQAKLQGEVERVFASQAADFTQWRRVLRLHQWLKNLLLFIPLFASHQIMQAALWQQLLLAFVAFSLCASSVYIANDLLDLESDRQHPRKRLRPFAAGGVSALSGVMLAPILLVLSLILANRVGPDFMHLLMLYFGLTCAYSWVLKRLILIDCLTLAVLYTLRIIAGAAALHMPISFWLLAFSIFLFLSLAFVKRYAELQIQVLDGCQKIHGRGYYTTDAPLLQMLGVTSGYAAVVVLALYLNSDIVLTLYRQPEIIWAAIPVMMFWISWIWMRAHRGEMQDDPLVFAIKDRPSLIAGLLFAAVLLVGAVGLPW